MKETRSPKPKQPSNLTVSLSIRELTSVLAALRLAEENHRCFRNMQHFIGAERPLSKKQIDALCERLNFM